MSGRTLVVGDIQGCADELNDLLGLVAFMPGSDHLVSVGDLVNRGPKSLEVVRRVRELGGETVLGNHELYLLSAAAGGPRFLPDTLGDLLTANDLPELLDWLIDRPEPLVVVRDDWVAVHAGFPPSFLVPEDALTANKAVRALWSADAPLDVRVAQVRANSAVQYLPLVRYCDDQGRMPEDDDAIDPPGYRPWFEYRKPGPVIPFGHWARLDPARAQRADLRFLDTGCVYGGSLTGWLVEEDRMVSVPARQGYWPPVRG